MGGYSIPAAEKQALAQAWTRADYRVAAPGRTLRLRVGAPAWALEHALPGSSYSLITACNPPPGPSSEADNRRAQQRLARVVGVHGWPATPAQASDGHGGWREPGWLLRNLAPGQARGLARRFGQGGLLYWRRGETVALVLLWHAQAGLR